MSMTELLQSIIGKKVYIMHLNGSDSSIDIRIYSGDIEGVGHSFTIQNVYNDILEVQCEDKYSSWIEYININYIRRITDYRSKITK